MVIFGSLGFLSEVLLLGLRSIQVYLWSSLCCYRELRVYLQIHFARRSIRPRIPASRLIIPNIILSLTIQMRTATIPGMPTSLHLIILILILITILRFPQTFIRFLFFKRTSFPLINFLPIIEISRVSMQHIINKQVFYYL